MSSNNLQNLKDDSLSEAESPSATLDTSPTTPPPRQEAFEDPTLGIPASFFSTSACTPSRYKTSSYLDVTTIGTNGEVGRANKELHHVIDQVVVGELADAMLTIDGIIEICLPDAKIGFLPSDALKRIQKGPKKNRLYDSAQWTGFQSTRKAPTEPKCKSFLEAIAKKAEGFIVRNGGGKRLRQYSDAFYKKPIKDDDCDRKPDLILPRRRITKKDIDNRNLPTWEGIDVPIEVRKAPKDAKGGHDELAESARLIFRHQPNRRSVFGVVLAGDEMTFCVFDRSGKVSSPPFNIHEKPELFLRVVVGLCYIDSGTLGIDQTINLEGPKESWSIDIEGTRYPIVDVVYTEGVIRGRGTACYEVRLEDGTSALMKDNWVDMSRDEREVDILKSLADIEHHEYVPTVVKDEVVQFQGEDDTTARIRESLLRKVVKDGKEEWEWIDDRYKSIEIRRHERILLTPFGMKIENFRSLEELLSAIKHIALVIWDFQKRNCLHRDISTRNVLLQNLKGRMHGLLIDYDYAIKSTRAWTNAIGHCTGTVPFMAIDVLVPANDMVHAYDHDLESLFYVLCWICSIFDGPVNTRRAFSYKESEIRRWNAFDDSKTSMRSVKDSKLAIMPNKKLFEKEITKKFAAYFEPIVPCIEKLRKMLFSAFHVDDDDIPETQRRLKLALSASPPDAAAILSLVYQLPIRARDPDTVCKSFVDILGEGIQGLPAEHRRIPWTAPGHAAGKKGSPDIEMSRPLDVAGVMDKRKEDTSTNKKGANVSLSQVVRRSLRHAPIIEGASQGGQSRGTKRSLAMDEPGVNRIPSVRSSKRLKSMGEKSSRMDPPQVPSISSANSSMPMTPSDERSDSSLRVLIGEQDPQAVNSEKSKR